jgi:hypothetical protein
LRNAHPLLAHHRCHHFACPGGGTARPVSWTGAAPAT